MFNIHKVLRRIKYLWIGNDIFENIFRIIEVIWYSLHSAIITEQREKKPIVVVRVLLIVYLCVGIEDIFETFEIAGSLRIERFFVTLCMDGTFSRDFGTPRVPALFTQVDLHVLCVAAMNVTVSQASACVSVSVRVCGCINFIPTHRNSFHLAWYYSNKMAISNEVFHEHLLEYAGNVFNGIWFCRLLSRSTPIVWCDMYIVHTRLLIVHFHVTQTRKNVETEKIDAFES